MCSVLKLLSVVHLQLLLPLVFICCSFESIPDIQQAEWQPLKTVYSACL